MNFLICGFFIVYFTLLFLILVLGLLLHRKKENESLLGKKIQLDQITVIIPFRNEEKRIVGLLESIRKSKKLPSKVLFINDHSEDNSIGLITSQLTEIPFEILELPTKLFGKKQAIRFGIKHCETEYILCMDADVSFSENYFEQLEKLTSADMYLLPAVLVAKRAFEHLFEIDLLLINALNTGLNGLSRPIIASGANLLFKRESFLKFDQIEKHAHIPSGDDIYLLRDFREAKCDVRVVANKQFQVITETPKSFNEFLHQRIRWIAKTSDVKDHLSTFLAIFQIILTLGFIGIIVKLIWNHQYQFALAIYGLKTILDMALFFSFFKEFKRPIAWFLIPVYQLIFPMYNLLLLITLPFFKPQWKGRYSGVNRR